MISDNSFYKDLFNPDIRIQWHSWFICVFLSHSTRFQLYMWRCIDVSAAWKRRLTYRRAATSCIQIWYGPSTRRPSTGTRPACLGLSDRPDALLSHSGLEKQLKFFFKQKQKYRGMFETRKSGNKTSSGEIGLNIRTLASPKVGQDQVSGGVSVLYWQVIAFPICRPAYTTLFVTKSYIIAPFTNSFIFPCII